MPAPLEVYKDRAHAIKAVREGLQWRFMRLSKQR